MKPIRKVLSAVFGALVAVGTANAAIIYQTGPNTVSIPGLTGFATTGAMMDGLSIRAVFSGGLDETRLWADTGPTSGGCLETAGGYL